MAKDKAVDVVHPVTGEVLPAVAGQVSPSQATALSGTVLVRGGRKIKIVENVSRPDLQLREDLDEQELFVTFEAAPKKRTSREGNQMLVVDVINHDAADTPMTLVLGKVFANKLAERYGADANGDPTLEGCIGKAFLIQRFRKPAAEGQKRRYFNYNFSQVELDV